MSSTQRTSPSAAPRASGRLAARVASVAIISIGIAGVFPSVSGAAQAPVGLGTADSFAVLAGQGITNANATTIVGDVGSFPNPAETGFDTVTLTGTNHHGDAVTQQAKDDIVTAYNQAAGAGPPTSVAVELGGTTLKPGVYNGATLEITGILTLDTEGNPDAVFIFQTGSTLITAANSSVIVLNGGTACNVFWKVPSSATLGTNSHLIGTVLASTAIAATSGATIEGRLLAQTASVTLDHNTITTSTCAASTTTTIETGGPTTPTTTTSGSNDTISPGGPTQETSGQSTVGTPGQSTATTVAPGTPGAPRTPRTPGGPTPPTAPGPPLARTGFDSPLPLVSAALIVFGGLMCGLSRVRRQQSRP
jgi:hypothetical protein